MTKGIVNYTRTTSEIVTNGGNIRVTMEYVEDGVDFTSWDSDAGTYRLNRINGIIYFTYKISSIFRETYPFHVKKITIRFFDLNKYLYGNEEIDGVVYNTINTGFPISMLMSYQGSSSFKSCDDARISKLRVQDDGCEFDIIPLITERKGGGIDTPTNSDHGEKSNTNTTGDVLLVSSGQVARNIVWDGLGNDTYRTSVSNLCETIIAQGTINVE